MNKMKCTIYGCPIEANEEESPRYCDKHAVIRKEELYNFYLTKINLPSEKAMEIAVGAVRA